MAEERVTLSLDDGVMTDRRQVVDEPAEVEETTDVVEESEKPTKKSGKKAKKEKPAKVAPKSRLETRDELEIEIPEKSITDTYIGDSEVMQIGLVGKVCNDSALGSLMLENIPVENIVNVKRFRVVIPDKKLKESIAVNGVLEPIVVAPLKDDYSKFALIDGAKRLNACKELDIDTIPCVYGHDWICKDLAYLEAMCNMHTNWSGAEYINFVKKCKAEGIRNELVIESLCSMRPGDAHKALDILEDDDPTILGPLMNGKFDKSELETAQRKLDARRKKDEVAEKDAALGGEDAEDTVLEGEGGFNGEITPYSADVDMDSFNNVGDDTLGELKDEFARGKDVEGYGVHHQKVGERECLDPAIRKAAIAKANNMCLCCHLGGPSYVDCIDAHHIVPVYLGGEDSVENTAILCISCHRMVHLYGTGDLPLDPALQKDYEDLTDAEKMLYPTEQNFVDARVKMRNIAKLGNIIREGAAAQKIKRDELKKEHPVGNLGRRMPGKNGVQTEA